MSQEELVKNLETVLGRGAWGFGLLLPLYRSQLTDLLLNRKGVDSVNLPISALALLFYTNLNPTDLVVFDKKNSQLPTEIKDVNITLFDKLNSLFIGQYIPQEANSPAIPVNFDGLVSKTHTFSSELGSAIESINLKFFRCATSQFNAASNPKALGVIAIGGQFHTLDVDMQVRSIVHEMAHQELFLVNLADRLILPGSEANLAYAPLQKKDRPLIGRLHSAHALYRMAQFEKHSKMNLVAPSRDLLTQTLQGLPRESLTEFGKYLIDGVYKSNG